MRAFFYTWHRRLAVIAGVFTLLWALSGLLHPFVSAWGPRPAAFKPPVVEFSESPSHKGFREVLKQLEGQSITQLRLVKVKPDWAWQVKTAEGFSYFDPDFGKKRSDFGYFYADYLARYYSGSEDKIKGISLQDHFNLTYAPVSRLLPVYKVDFQTPHDLTAYVDPTSDRLGGMTDDVRAIGLGAFQLIHTLSFLEPVEAVRVLIVLFSVLTIVAISGLGIGLRLTMKARRTGAKTRIITGLLLIFSGFPFS